MANRKQLSIYTAILIVANIFMLFACILMGIEALR